MDIDGWIERAFKKPVTTLFLFCILMTACGAIFTGLGFVTGFIGDTAQVVKEEVSPRALLSKYEWFKDASAQLDKKLADIGVYESRIQEIHTAYKIENIPRNKYDRADKEQLNVWASEVAGVRASYNQLAAEYNAQMSKINWAFTNVGDLPQGASNPLPREYKPYN